MGVGVRGGIFRAQKIGKRPLVKIKAGREWEWGFIPGGSQHCEP